MADHRASPRKRAPNVGLLDVWAVLEGGSKKYLGSSLLIDVSRGGIAIQLDKAVQANTKLWIHNKLFSQCATVRHCKNLGGTFRLGLQFCTFHNAPNAGH